MIIIFAIFLTVSAHQDKYNDLLVDEETQELVTTAAERQAQTIDLLAKDDSTNDEGKDNYLINYVIVRPIPTKDNEKMSVTSVPSDKSATGLIIGTRNYESANMPTILDSNVYTTMTKNTGEANTDIGEKYSVVTKNGSRKNQTETTLFISDLKRRNNEQVMNSPKFQSAFGRARKKLHIKRKYKGDTDSVDNTSNSCASSASSCEKVKSEPSSETKEDEKEETEKEKEETEKEEEEKETDEFVDSTTEEPEKEEEEEKEEDKSVDSETKNRGEPTTTEKYIKPYMHKKKLPSYLTSAEIRQYLYSVYGTKDYEENSKRSMNNNNKGIWNPESVVRNKDTIEDQPYFALVYKYFPHLSHYNPKNNLKLNEVKENSIEVVNRLRKREPKRGQLNKLIRFLKYLNRLQGLIKSDKDSIRSSNEAISIKTDKGTNEVLNYNEKNNMNTVADINYEKNNKDIHINAQKFQDTIRNQLSNQNKISIYMNALKDLILNDSKALMQYDWLTTTLQIQSVLSKTLELIKRIRQSEPIHLVDLQILRYIVFLHNLSLEIKKDNKLNNMLIKRVKVLSRNKKKRKMKLLKEKGLINRVWLYLRVLLPDPVEEDEFSHLYKFLINAQDGLFDLHEAIRHIADVTKFDRQNWYGNLKQLYLSADEKHLRELLLHISMSRLVDLVEHSCKHALDHDFIQFMQTNEKEANRIVKEMLFIENIVDELKIK